MEREKDLCDCRIIHLVQVEKARAGAQAPEVIEALSQTFKALGDATRLRILQALAQDEMCVCDLAAFLGVTESAVSHQLRLLRTLRLVCSRRDGPVQYYRLADQHVSQLVAIALEHVKE